ncbi:NAD-dependent epimerase/dehydratase family protein [uncultured Eudoraea sp.]|uniref:NAD-dependent epimerase/dehydratase family protein n=1 Tax=uncultured Eudoraea sp. TaxID=1035614 RepID=UPI00260532B4|nr:NAD-dependent epimerase/dehydratase family protein [uncultured Eudoraea sp.]
MILVTGGTGLVGSHLLLHLLASGASVRAIHRKNSDLQKVKEVFSYYREDSLALFSKIQWVEADLNNIPALELAFKGVTMVYHSAALISFDPHDFDSLHKINKVGTENIVNLCIDKKIKKLCYVSSIAAIGKSTTGNPVTEEKEWNDTNANVYAYSKHFAEIEVWRGAQEGVPVVIVNPGIILGPGYWENGSGLLFKTSAKGMRYYFPGGTGFISVGDVIKIMVQLMNSPIENERFIAVAENLSYRSILEKISQGFNKPAPKIGLKFWQLEIFRRMDWAICLITNKKRKLTKNGLEALRNPQNYDNSKVNGTFKMEYESIQSCVNHSCKKYLETHSTTLS